MLDFDVGMGGQDMKCTIALSEVLQNRALILGTLAVRVGYVLERALVWTAVYYMCMIHVHDL